MQHIALLMGAYLALINLNPSKPNVNTSEWDNYKLMHGKEYSNNEEDSLRRFVLAHNKQQVEKFHTLAEEAEMFQLDASNQFADWSEVEMAQLNGFKLPKNELTGKRESSGNSLEAQEFLNRILNNKTAIPDEVDWRKVPGRVSEVKNQGMCGSCWAFSTTGALEGQERVRGVNGSNIIELSEQNLVDCVKADFGCNGGYMKDAMDFIKQEGGIDDEQSYPYEAKTKKCRFRKDKVVINDAGGALLPVGDEQKLKEVVAKFGPVAVAIDASSFWFQLYHKGVYVNKHCKNKEEQLDHGVLVVGYGTDNKKGDYWIVKNSWGPHWGEKGYIRMARNRNNMCGIATAATIPIF